jgi:aspartyl-tRNA(Asn)/glutamyl-tRNA(Gln) amidotransferase subunit B
LRGESCKKPSQSSRYIASGIKEADAIQFAAYPVIGDYIDTVTARHANDPTFIQRAANYIANDLVNILRDTNNRDSEIQAEIPISAHHFESIISMIGDGKISSRVAKDLLLHVIEEKKDPLTLATERGLLMRAESPDLSGVIDGILEQNPTVVADYKNGKEAALQFLIGQGMKALKGAVNPAQLKEELVKKISK